MFRSDVEIDLVFNVVECEVKVNTAIVELD